MATSEAMVLHHGREADMAVQHDARPSASTACWAADEAPLPGTDHGGWTPSNHHENRSMLGKRHPGSSPLQSGYVTSIQTRFELLSSSAVQA